MAKAIKLIAFVIPSLFMALILLFVPEVADIVSIFYVGLVGTFIGADLVAMIQRTKSLPDGEFDKLNAWRYITASVFLVGLLAIAFYKYHTGVEIKTTVVSLSSSVLLVSSMIIAGLDGNRIVTGDPAKTAPADPKEVK